MISCCGLDCSKCECYLATKADDDSKREEVAKKWSAMYGEDIKPKDINCSGCRPEGPKFTHCYVCEIRRCCMEKGVENCAGCDMYICDKLESFFKMAPEARTALDYLRKQ